MHGHFEDIDGDGASTCPLVKSNDGKEELRSVKKLHGFHYLLGATPDEREAFLGYGSNSPYDKNSTQKFMIWLARRVAENQITEENFDDWENKKSKKGNKKTKKSGIPAGYTYLLQLACHDLVHSSIPITTMSTVDRPLRNMRRVGLDLETLFGGGPNVCPFAYASSNRGQFRWQLKLGPTSAAKSETAFNTRGPIRDLVREDRPDFSKRKSNEPIKGDSPAENNGARVHDVMIADPRNEDTQILAQLTALFHAFHNIVVERMESVFGECGVDKEHGHSVNDIGVCSRAVTAYIFRKIIRNDLLERILNKDIYNYYNNNPNFIDPISKNGSVSLEFAHAVSRVGHQMVRPNYRFNKIYPSNFTLKEIFSHKQLGLAEPSLNFPNLPSWIIDWSLFFDCGSGETRDDIFNWSAKFGLHTATFLSLSENFVHPYNGNGFKGNGGLVFRDLIRGAAAGLPKVSTLISAIKRRASEDSPISDLLPDEQAQREMVDQALRNLSSADDDEIDNPWIGKIAGNPPLFLYALVEAMEDGMPGPRLGPLGSVIFAETFFRAILREHTDVDSNVVEWEQKSKAWASQVLDQPIADMGDLIKTVRRHNPEALQIPDAENNWIHTISDN